MGSLSMSYFHIKTQKGHCVITEESQLILGVEISADFRQGNEGESRAVNASRQYKPYFLVI